MYAKRGRSWVALFDPVGAQDEWSELVWRFVELADAHSGRAAFYQVRPDSLPMYLDAGLRVVKVGEEACIDLRDFSLQGSHRYGLRQTLKRAEREGLEFEILSAERVCAERLALSDISDAWLAKHGGHERRFSVAAFEPGFVAAQQVALARQGGTPVAFVTLHDDRQAGRGDLGADAASAGCAALRERVPHHSTGAGAALAEVRNPQPRNGAAGGTGAYPALFAMESDGGAGLGARRTHLQFPGAAQLQKQVSPGVGAALPGRLGRDRPLHHPSRSGDPRERGDSAISAATIAGIIRRIVGGMSRARLAIASSVIVCCAWARARLCLRWWALWAGKNPRSAKSSRAVS